MIPSLPYDLRRAKAGARAVNAAEKGDMLSLRRARPVFALLALAALLCAIGARMGDMAAPHIDVTALPTSFGSWVMSASEHTDPKNLSLGDALASQLSLDSYTQRVYVDRATGQQLQLLVEYRRLGRGAFNHRPEACYPAAGYALTGRSITAITYGGQPASALTCVADYQGQRGTSHQVLLYWFGTGDRTETNFFLQQVEMAFGRLRPEKNGWIFVRLIDECPRGTEAQALAAEKDFTARASSSLVQIISPTAAR